MKKNNAGFTLVESLISISILAISVLFITFLNQKVNDYRYQSVFLMDKKEIGQQVKRTLYFHFDCQASFQGTVNLSNVSTFTPLAKTIPTINGTDGRKSFNQGEKIGDLTISNIYIDGNDQGLILLDDNTSNGDIHTYEGLLKVYVTAKNKNIIVVEKLASQVKIIFDFDAATNNLVSCSTRYSLQAMEDQICRWAFKGVPEQGACTYNGQQYSEYL